MMDVVERDLQLAAILCGERLVALFLPLADLGLDRGLVDALDFMVHMHVDVERLAERSEQMVLVQLRVAFHGLVLDSGRDLAQHGERLALQLRKSMGHASLRVTIPDDTVEHGGAADQLLVGIPMRLPTMMRSRSTPSNAATFGSSPHRRNPKRSNNARLGLLWPNMNPSSVSTSNAGASANAWVSRYEPNPRFRNASWT